MIGGSLDRKRSPPVINTRNTREFANVLPAFKDGISSFFRFLNGIDQETLETHSMSLLQGSNVQSHQGDEDGFSVRSQIYEGESSGRY